jgi:hypothetical protein
VRGHLRQRGDAFQLVVYAGQDDLIGKRRYVRKTVRGTKREAQRELARFITEVGGAITSPSPAPSVSSSTGGTTMPLRTGLRRPVVSTGARSMCASSPSSATASYGS